MVRARSIFYPFTAFLSDMVSRSMSTTRRGFRLAMCRSGLSRCSHRPKRSFMHGFTLIELLVVIAIISLLVSILLPSLSRVKDLAKRAACGSQLHHISVACEMYVGDNDGRVPENQNRYAHPYATDVWLDSSSGEFSRGKGHVLLLPYLDAAAGEMGAGPNAGVQAREPAGGAWDFFRCPGYPSDDVIEKVYWSGGSGYTVSTLYNQFCGYEFAEGETQWIPNSSYRRDELDPRFPMYTDKTYGWPGQPFVAAGWNHDSVEFSGMYTAHADGSSTWVNGDDTSSDKIGRAHV